MSDHLFQLIRTLSPSEKRYFKIHAKTHVDAKYKTNYEKLFDALNYWEPEEYDENLFKRKHKGKAFLKNLPEQKRHLYELILKVGIQFSESNNEVLQTYAVFSQIEYLISKKLNQQAIALIEETRKLIEKKPNPVWKMLLHQIHFRLFSPANNNSPLSLKTLEEEALSILNQQQLYTRAHFINLKFGQHARMINPLDKKQQEEMVAEAKQLLTMPDLSVGAWFPLVVTLQQYLNMNNQSEEALQFSLNKIAEIEQSDKKTNNPVSYVAVVDNTIWVAETAKRYDLFPQLMEKQRQVTLPNPARAAKSFLSTYHAEVSYLKAMKLYERCDEVLKTIFKDLPKHRPHIAPYDLQSLLLDLADLEIKRKKWPQAIAYLNQTLVLQKEVKSNFTEISARTLRFISHALSGNYEVLENELRALKRYVEKEAVQHDFISALLEWMKAIIKEGKTNSSTVKKATQQLLLSPPDRNYDVLKEVIKEIMEP